MSRPCGQSPPPPCPGGIGAASLCFPPAPPWGSHHLLRRPPEAGGHDLGACLTPCKHPNSIRERKREGSGPPPSPRPVSAPRPSLRQPLFGRRQEKNKDFHRRCGGRAPWGGMQRTLTFPAEILPSQPAQGSAGPSWGFSRGFLRTTSFSSGWNDWEGKATIWDPGLGHLPGALSGLPPGPASCPSVAFLPPTKRSLVAVGDGGIADKLAVGWGGDKST